MGRGYVVHYRKNERVFPCIMRCFSSCLLSSFRTMNTNDSKKSVASSIHSVSTLYFSTDVVPPGNTIPNVYVKLNTSRASSYPYIITSDVEEMITKGDAESKLKLEQALLFLYLKREEGERLPEEISTNDLAELLSLNKEDQTEFLCRSHLLHNRRKEEVLVAARLQKEFYHDSLETSTMTDKHSYLAYNSLNNTLFSDSNLKKSSRSHYYNSVMAKGLQFGQSVVFDCSYENCMSYAEMRLTAYELNYCIRKNRRNRRPYGLYLSGVDENSNLLRQLVRVNPAIGYDLPLQIHRGSYLDIFHRQNIVYLSPYAEEILEYHPDHVYVIGGLTSGKRNLSLRKAGSDFVRCAKLP